MRRIISYLILVSMILTSSIVTYGFSTQNKTIDTVGSGTNGIVQNYGDGAGDVSAQTTGVSTVADTYAGDWSYRTSVTSKFKQYGNNGITNTNQNSGNFSGRTGMGAIWNQPLGTDYFRVSFDIIWNPANLDEGQAGYADSYLNVYITDSVTFPSGTAAYSMPGDCKVLNRHFLLHNNFMVNGTAVSKNPNTIIDFGGKTLISMGTAKMYVELKRNVLSYYIMDGTTKRGLIAYNVDEGFFTSDREWYLGFENVGTKARFTIDNITIEDLPPLLPDTNSVNGENFAFADSNMFLKADEVLAETPNTIEAWVKVPAIFKSGWAQPLTIISNYFTNDKEYLTFEITASGKLSLVWNGARYTAEETDLRTSEWAHVAVTRNKATGKLIFYVNGTNVAEFTAPTDEIMSDLVPLIGNSYLKYTIFHGMIADVRLWDYARTADEIKDNLFTVPEADTEGLSASWLLNESNTDIGDRLTERVSGNNLTVEGRWEVIDKPDSGEFDYSIAVIGDTQSMADYSVPETFATMTSWIADNAETEKIKMAVSVGDISNNPNDRQLAVAKDAFDLLDGIVPFIFTPGNHDEEGMSSTNPSRDTEMFNTYFPYSKYSATEYFGGAYEEGNMANTYNLLEIDGTKYMVLNLEYLPRTEILDWANEVVAEHSEYKVIVNTHYYLDIAGNIASSCTYIWDTFIRKHENMFMVLCGHIAVDNTLHRSDIGDNGNVVDSVIVNPQRLDFDAYVERDVHGIDALGMVLLLKFSEDGNLVKTEYYSTILGEYINEESHISFRTDSIAPSKIKSNISASMTDYNVTFNSKVEYDSFQLWFESNAGWQLVKNYSDSLESYTIDVADRNAKGKYNFYVRAKDNDGNILFQEEVYAYSDAGKTRLNFVRANGNIIEDTVSITTYDGVSFTAEAELNGTVRYEYYLKDQNGEYNLVSDNSKYELNAANSGAYTVKIVAYEDNNPANCDERIVTVYCKNEIAKITGTDIFSANSIKVGEAVVANLLGNYSSVSGYSNMFRYSISEPSVRTASTEFMTDTNHTFRFAYPGEYTVGAYIKNPLGNTYDDGIVRTVTVGRKDGMTVSATVAEEQSRLYGSKISVGDAIKLTVNGKSNIAYDGGYQYEFLRYDAKGKKLVKGWSSDNTLTWVPAKNGIYEIIVRVRAALDDNGQPIPANDGSYEYTETIRYTVGDVGRDFTDFAVSTDVQTPIEGTVVTATATLYDNVLYKFVISDDLLGTTVLKDYSPSNTVTFIPRRDGNYTIRAYVNDKDSFGYSDATAETKLTVIEDQLLTVFDSSTDISSWTAAGLMEIAPSGIGAVITKTSGSQNKKKSFTVDLDRYPVFEIKITDVDGAGLHVLMNDGTGDKFITASGSKKAAGTYTFNIPELTGWSGSKTFTLTLAAASSNVGDSVTIEYFSFKKE